MEDYKPGRFIVGKSFRIEEEKRLMNEDIRIQNEDKRLRREGNRNHDVTMALKNSIKYIYFYFAVIILLLIAFMVAYFLYIFKK